jgi:hypothetical protein
MPSDADKTTELDTACAAWWGEAVWASMPDDDAAMLAQQRDREADGRPGDAWQTNKAAEREIMQRMLKITERAPSGQ